MHRVEALAIDFIAISFDILHNEKGGGLCWSHGRSLLLAPLLSTSSFSSNRADTMLVKKKLKYQTRRKNAGKCRTNKKGGIREDGEATSKQVENGRMVTARIYTDFKVAKRRLYGRESTLVGRPGIARSVVKLSRGIRCHATPHDRTALS